LAGHRTHSSGVTDRSNTPRQLAGSQGFCWSPEFAAALARIGNGHYVVATLAPETGGIVFHSVSDTHGAGFSRGSAFCTFNFLAGTGFLLMRASRIGITGIIDLDSHTGSGTFFWVKDEPDLTAFDISGNDSFGNVAYPSRAEYYDSVHGPCWCSVVNNCLLRTMSLLSSWHTVSRSWSAPSRTELPLSKAPQRRKTQPPGGIQFTRSRSCAIAVDSNGRSAERPESQMVTRHL